MQNTWGWFLSSTVYLVSTKVYIEILSNPDII